jgi:N-acyl-D-aspartate/D-glutamate deacylase
MHDIVIRNGTVIDGSGAAARTADVAIDGERVTAVGNDIGPGKREIDAGGLLVTPGWVDIHTHYDGQATWDPYMTPSSWHGATTVVMGNCGVGFAPARPEERDWLISLMESVEDIPGTALAEGMTWNWESFPEYLDALEAQPRAIDIGTQVPHCAVRSYVMGERSLSQLTAGADDIEAMGRIVQEGLEAGALGFSTSRTVIHLTKDGEVVPGTYAGKQEMLGLGRAMQRAGHGVLELASDFTEEDADLGWMKQLSIECGVPVSVNLLQNDFQPTGWREVLERIEQANADGARLVAQVSGRTTGILMCLEGTVTPFAARPTWRALQKLPLAERVAELSRSEVKAQVLSEGLDREVPGIVRFMLRSWHKMWPLGELPDYEPLPEESLQARAEALGCSAEELAYDLLLENGGKGMIYFPLLNYADNDFEPIREMMLHPDARFGLSDGGAHCGVICDVSMPSYLLSYWARDRERGEKLPLEWLVHKQTRDTASLFGLDDRGLLAPGYRADINLIDFDGLQLKAPRMIYDLPGGARRLVQEVAGYRMTLCAGQVIYEDGEPTGALPGRLVRGPQPAP